MSGDWSDIMPANDVLGALDEAVRLYAESSMTHDQVVDELLKLHPQLTRKTANTVLERGKQIAAGIGCHKWFVQRS